jgi:hypothetical protein
VIAAAIRNEHFVEAKALIEARFKSEPMDSKALFELSVIATNDLRLHGNDGAKGSWF